MYLFAMAFLLQMPSVFLSREAERCEEEDKERETQNFPAEISSAIKERTGRKEFRRGGGYHLAKTVIWDSLPDCETKKGSPGVHAAKKILEDRERENAEERKKN